MLLLKWYWTHRYGCWAFFSLQWTRLMQQSLCWVYVVHHVWTHVPADARPFEECLESLPDCHEAILDNLFINTMAWEEILSEAA